MNQRAERDFRELIEHLAGDAHCPLCGARYSREAICITREAGTRWRLSVQCHCCGTASQITATMPPPEQAFEVPMELTPAEAFLFAQTQPLSEDDVLDVHIFLKHFLGDFTTLGASLSNR
jgi:hypothetical protein